MWKKVLRKLPILRATGPLARFEMLRSVARLLLPNYRFKWPQMAWWEDAFFNLYLDRFGERAGMNTDRRWMVYQLMRLVSNVPGDTAECGVYRGAGSFLICRLSQAGSVPREHLIFDSFEGLSAPSESDGTHWMAGDMACGLEEVQRNLAEFPNTRYFQGWIPSRFAEVADRRFAFVHIDVDLHRPTLDSIEFFYPRMSPGGVILCDDYGFTSCPGVTRACDEYLADKPERMIALCSGGGFLLKGTRTAPTLR
jgi:O-methyltransferase